MPIFYPLAAPRASPTDNRSVSRATRSRRLAAAVAAAAMELGRWSYGVVDHSPTASAAPEWVYVVFSL